MRVRFRIPIGEGAPVNMLHQYAKVTATRYTADACEVEAQVPESIRRRLKKYVVVKRAPRKKRIVEKARLRVPNVRRRIGRTSDIQTWDIIVNVE